MVAATRAGLGRDSTSATSTRHPVRRRLAAGSPASTSSPDHYVDYCTSCGHARRWQIVNTLWRWADGHGPSRLTVRSRRTSCGGAGRADRGRGTRIATGFVEREGGRISYEVYGSGEPTDRVRADLADHPFARLEGADPVLRAAPPGGHLRQPRQRRAPTGRRIRPYDDDRGRAANLVAVLDATGVERGGPRLSSRRGRWSSSLAAASGTRRRPRVHLSRRCRSATRGRSEVRPVRGATRHGRRLGQGTTATSGGATTAASSSSSSGRLLRAALDEADRRRRRLGPRHRPGDAGPDHEAHAASLDTRGRSRPYARRSAARSLVIQGTEDRIRARPRAAGLAARDPGAPPRSSSRAAATSQRPRPRQGQPAHPRVRRLVRGARDDAVADGHDLDHGPSSAGGGRCTSRRRSAWATPSATSPSPTSCGSSSPTSRSTGSPSIPSRRSSNRAASGSIR